MQTIEEYNKERDVVISTDSIPAFMAWAKSKGFAFSNILSAEIALHKMRTACVNLPLEMRLASDKWLRNRGYESWF